MIDHRTTKVQDSNSAAVLTIDSDQCEFIHHYKRIGVCFYCLPFPPL